MSELAILQAVRLKGRGSPTDLAATLGENQADVTATVDRLIAAGVLAGGTGARPAESQAAVTAPVDRLIAAGLLVEATTLRISSPGRARLSELLAEERQGVDSAAMPTASHEFRSVNAH